MSLYFFKGALFSSHEHVLRSIVHNGFIIPASDRSFRMYRGRHLATKSRAAPVNASRVTYVRERTGTSATSWRRTGEWRYSSTHTWLGTGRRWV